MTDHYYLIELSDGVESWRSDPCVERRRLELLSRVKKKANPSKTYRLELRQDEGSRRY